MGQKQTVLDKLNAMGISFELIEHPAVYTIEEMERLNLSRYGHVCKNLFLRDAKGKRHILVTMAGDKRADLNRLSQQLETTKLGFASAERLEKYLGLHKGEVTPLGVLNDADAVVEVVFDSSLKNYDLLGVHPNDNTATVWLHLEDLERIVKENGNSLQFLDFEAADR